MLLEPRIFTPNELAEWFGITKKSFSNSRAKKLQELCFYASFEDLGGAKGVLIKEVWTDTYDKKNHAKVSKSYSIIKDNFFNAWHKSGYDTAARVGSQIWRESSELQKLISENTAKIYASKVRTEYYGRVHIKEAGTRGTCKYAYVKSNAWEEAVLLSQEHEEIIAEIRRKIYDNDQAPLLHEAYKNHEITKEQYDAAIDEWNSSENRESRYNCYMEEVYEALGYWPNKVTKVQDEVNW